MYGAPYVLSSLWAEVSMCEPECSKPEPLICWPRLCTELNRAQPRISQDLIMRQCAIFVLDHGFTRGCLGAVNRYNSCGAAGPQLLLHLDHARPAVAAGRIAFGLGFDESGESQ